MVLQGSPGSLRPPGFQFETWGGLWIRAPVPDPVFQVRWHLDGNRPLKRLKSEVRTRHRMLGRSDTFSTLPALTRVRSDSLHASLPHTPERFAVSWSLSFRKKKHRCVRFQLVPLAWLLDLCLLSELCWGFKLLGPLPASLSWLNPSDAKYPQPHGRWKKRISWKSVLSCASLGAATQCQATPACVVRGAAYIRPRPCSRTSAAVVAFCSHWTAFFSGCARFSNPPG